jgi:hypothetical protein
MTQPDFALSVEEFDILCGDLGQRPALYPLEVPSVGRTFEERALRGDAVYRELADRGLATGTRMAPRLRDALELLSRHELSVDAVGYVGEPLRAVAVTDHRTAVLASLVGDTVLLAEIRPTALARSIVELLPPNDAGPGRAMSVQASALAAALDPADDDDPFADEDMDERTALRRAGLSSDDASALLDLAGSRVAGGQFGISHHGRRVSTLVTWFDTHQGRYLMVSEDSWLSFAPADNDRIERRVATVLTKAVEAR